MTYCKDTGDLRLACNCPQCFDVRLCGVRGCTKRALRGGGKALCRKHAQVEREERKAALEAQMGAVNAAIEAGVTILIPTAWGDQVLCGVGTDFGGWSYHTVTQERWAQTGGRREFYNLHTRSYAGCGDSIWSRILQQAGVSR